jgi:hypothetical protein
LSGLLKVGDQTAKCKIANVKCRTSSTSWLHFCILDFTFYI